MTQDIQGLKGQLACLDYQVSKAPKAERDVQGFQASQVHLAIPVKEVLPGYQDNRDSLGLREVQVPQVRRDREGIWGLLDRLE